MRSTGTPLVSGRKKKTNSVMRRTQLALREGRVTGGDGFAALEN
jgi:hypothetical protein